MSVPASLVKRLRERTGAGLMDCKAALMTVFSEGGDLDAALEAAVDVLRKSGQAKADKKSSRVAAEGLVLMAQDLKRAVIAEFNCETDFVARDESFVSLSQKVIQVALSSASEDWASLSEQMIEQDGAAISVENARQALVVKIGENIQLRRFHSLAIPAGAVVGSYSHGGRIGVLVLLEGGDEAFAKDLAIHIAASSPECISSDELSPELLAKEREIYLAQALESGKPPAVVEKMVEGRIRRFMDESTLLGQIFVKDNPDGLKVSHFVQQKKARVLSFVRYQVGEGIEKKTENFAEEVMAQVKSAT